MASRSHFGQDMMSLPIRAAAMHKRLLVAAIDFGTTYSGYAWQTLADYEKDPLMSIKANNWKTSRSGMSYKAPTCILFDKNKIFQSFGYEAETKYNEAATNGDTWSWFFFKRFKMVLYNEQNLDRSTELQDEKGLKMPALDVFSASIKFLKDHLIRAFEETNMVWKPSEVHWVLTVPAIWSDVSKKFMREAAIEAGIPTDQLSLSLEPEAASLFCRYKPIKRVVGKEGAEIQSFTAGDRYMIIDAGGGTVDITVHEVQEEGTLKEFAKANGGEWGGTKVDEKFEKFLTDIFGPDVIEVIQQRYAEDFLELMNMFEVKKRIISPDMSEKQTFTIPKSFADMYKDLNNVGLDQSTLFPAHLKNRISFRNDKLRVEADLLKDFFSEVCDQICAITSEFLGSLHPQNVDNILMVGGFSESLMLQEKVRKTFPNRRIIIPDEAGLAVLKGAVLFGHNPTMIVARVCRLSYGIRAFKHFEPGIDPQNKRVVQNKVVLCKDFFSKHATVGQEFNTEEKVYSQEYIPSDATGSELEVWIYTSPRKHPLYVDEEGCCKIGEMRVKLKDIQEKCGAVKIQFEFGKTELEIKVVDSKTNAEIKSANFEIL